MENTLFSDYDTELYLSNTQFPTEEQEGVEEEPEQSEIIMKEDMSTREKANLIVEDAENQMEESEKESPSEQMLGFNGQIIEDDSDVHISAYLPEEEEENGWNKLLAHRYRGTILERPITSVDLPSKEGRPLVISVMVEGFRVLIASEDFFEPSVFPEHYTELPYMQRIELERQIASRMIGSRIPFIITEANKTWIDNEPVYQVKGSRKIAMEKKRDYYFFSEDRRPPEIGTQVKVRVLMASYSKIRVEALGVEVDIPASELSSCRWVSPIEECPPGSVMYFLLKKCSINQDRKKVSLDFTRKPLDARQMKKNINQCHIGARYGATIVGITDRVYLASLDGIEVRAVIPRAWYFGPRLTYGDKVSFQVVNVEGKYGYVRGNCIYLPQKVS